MTERSLHVSYLELLVLLVVAAATPLPTSARSAQEHGDPPLPFHLPAPEGWGTETIPFPLSFASQLTYRGLEELRFAPGMFVEGSEDFWSYAFVWWVEPGGARDVDRLRRSFEHYYRGLASGASEVPVDAADLENVVHVDLQLTEDGYTGQLQVLDTFVTQKPVQLHLRGNVWLCEEANREVFWFALSPQTRDHPVWRQLEEIRAGFRCKA